MDYHLEYRDDGKSFVLFTTDAKSRRLVHFDTMDALTIAGQTGRLVELDEFAAENERLSAELAHQNELRRMEAEALAGVGKEVERLLRARIAALETALRGATHEVLFDPTGPRHVMAIDMAAYHAALAALEQA